MAVRYVDDITVVLVNTPAAKALLADLVQNALPPECELEIEQPLGVSVRMLECAVSVLDGTVLITHHNKNAASLQESGVQQFRKFVDYWLGPKGFAYSGRYPTCSEPRIHRSNQVMLRCCDQRASCPKTGQHPLTPVSIFRAFPDSHALFDNPSKI